MTPASVPELPEFLEPDVVLFIHDQALREFGGLHGLRAEPLLHSALARPKHQYLHAAADLFQLAAAYAYGLANNHPFNDANKRTAWACCVLFLKLNQIELNVSAPDVIDHMQRLVSHQIDESAFAAWLSSRLNP